MVTTEPGSTLIVDFDIENQGDIAGDGQDITLTTENGTKVTVDTLEDFTVDPGQIESGVLEWNTDIEQTKQLYTLCINTSDGTDCVSVAVTEIDAGSVIYIAGDGTNSVYQYNLLPRYDLSTNSLNGSFDLSGEETGVSSIEWSPDGTTLYTLGYLDETTYSYTASTAFDVTTLSLADSNSITTNRSNPTDILWNDTGSMMYICDTNEDSIFSYSAGSNFSISSLTLENEIDVSTQTPGTTGVTWNNDGTKVYTIGSGNNTIASFNLSTAYDITTLSPNQTFDISSEKSLASGVSFSITGDEVFIGGFTNNTVHSYTMTTDFDISTASLNQTFDVSSEESSLRGVTFNASPHYNV